MSYLYACSRTSPLSLPVPQDPNAEEVYTMEYRPAAWSANTRYLEMVCGDVGDMVIPVSETGFVYEVVSGGISGDTEPVWPTVSDGTVDDGTVKWKAKPAATLALMPTDTITSSDWFTDNSDITLGDDGVAGGKTFVKVSTVPVGLIQFILTNRITILRGVSAITEIMDRSVKIKVKEM